MSNEARPLVCAHWMDQLKVTNRWANEFTKQDRRLISEVVEVTCECGETFLYHGTRAPVTAIEGELAIPALSKE